MKKPAAAALGLAAVLATAFWMLPGDGPLASYRFGPEAVFPWHLTPQPESADPAAPQATATPTPDRATPPAAPRGPAVAELCGIGPVSLPAGAEGTAAAGGLDALPATLGRQALEEARRRMLERLQSSGEPRATVAALLLQRPATDDAQALRTWGSAIVQAALAQRDTVAMAWAEEACGHLEDGPACRQSLVRARLAAEPDNAQHWAAWADEDPAAADAAWQGLVQAGRWHQGPYALVATALRALPADVPGYLRAALAAELTTLSGTLPTPGEGFVQERCTEPAPERAAQCAALAERLAAQGDSPGALAQALRVGRLAGWTEARAAPLQARYEHLVQAESAWRTRPDQPLSCDGVEAWLQQFERVAAAPR